MRLLEEVEEVFLSVGNANFSDSEVMHYDPIMRPKAQTTGSLYLSQPHRYLTPPSSSSSRPECTSISEAKVSLLT